MVRGLELFREHFRQHKNKYVIIGGTACDIYFESIGVDFRTTKDLDIVLIIEALDIEFAKVFWAFVKKGNYMNIQKSTGKKLFYRFYDPRDKAFPYMLELFSRIPDFLQNFPENNLAPISFNNEASSLSVILLENDYYEFLKKGVHILKDFPILLPEYLIPFKAKAYLDLLNSKNSGRKIDNKDILKHRNDIFRLYGTLSSNIKVELPSLIADEMKTFLKIISVESVNLTPLNVSGSTKEIIRNLKHIYGIDTGK